MAESEDISKLVS